MILLAGLIFLTVMAPILEETDCSVTSWYRTKNRNIEVHGVLNSKHMTGEAIDVICDTNKGKQEFIRKSKILGLRVVIYPDHIHAEVDDEQTIYARYIRSPYWYRDEDEGDETTGGD
jgi:hypothetical protein